MENYCHFIVNGFREGMAITSFVHTHTHIPKFCIKITEPINTIMH